MTTDLLPRKQRTLCRECQEDVYGLPESYTFETWPAGRCRRSRKWHRRQATLRQPGTMTYRNGQVIHDVPLPEEGEAPSGPAS